MSWCLYLCVLLLYAVLLSVTHVHHPAHCCSISGGCHPCWLIAYSSFCALLLYPWTSLSRCTSWTSAYSGIAASFQELYSYLLLSSYRRLFRSLLFQLLPSDVILQPFLLSRVSLLTAISSSPTKFEIFRFFRSTQINHVLRLPIPVQ